MGDAKETMFVNHGVRLEQNRIVDELVYVDHALLLGSDAFILTTFTNCIEMQAGSTVCASIGASERQCL